MKAITENEFKDLSSGTVVVQFSATWCGPCKVLSNLIDVNEDKFVNQVYKIDIDEAPTLSQALRIRSVPTLIRFEDHVEVKRVVGNQPLESLIELTS